MVTLLNSFRRSGHILILICLQSLANVYDKPKQMIEPFKQPKLYNKSDEIHFRTDHLDTVYGFNAKVRKLLKTSKLR